MESLTRINRARLVESFLTQAIEMAKRADLPLTAAKLDIARGELLATIDALNEARKVANAAER